MWMKISFDCKYDRHDCRRDDRVLRNWKTAVVTGKENTHGDEEEEPAGPRFTSVQRHLTPSWKIVRPTVLINGLLTVWRIVAGKGETTRWWILILSQNCEILGISTKKLPMRNTAIILQFYTNLTNLYTANQQYYNQNKWINIRKIDRTVRNPQ